MIGHHHHKWGMGPRGGWKRGAFEAEWSFGPGGRRGGGGRRRLFDSGELRLVLLKLIADQPRHGYDLIRAIEELTGGVYAPSAGVVYPTITLLQDMGLIEEQATEGPRKAYAATPDGIAYLEERTQEVEALLGRLAALGAMERKVERAPVRRAIQNLRAVLHDRLTRDDADTDMAHDIAALLDEAARKIERL